MIVDGAFFLSHFVVADPPCGDEVAVLLGGGQEGVGEVGSRDLVGARFELSDLDGDCARGPVEWFVGARSNEAFDLGGDGKSETAGSVMIVDDGGVG